MIKLRTKKNIIYITLLFTSLVSCQSQEKNDEIFPQYFRQRYDQYLINSTRLNIFFSVGDCNNKSYFNILGDVKNEKEFIAENLGIDTNWIWFKELKDKNQEYILNNSTVLFLDSSKKINDKIEIINGLFYNNSSIYNGQGDRIFSNNGEGFSLSVGPFYKGKAILSILLGSVYNKRHTTGRRKWVGLIDTTGKVINDPNLLIDFYDHRGRNISSPFSYYHFRNRWVEMDTIFFGSYQKAPEFDKQHTYYFTDLNGNKLYNPNQLKFHKINPFSDCGLALVADNKESYYFIDTNGNKVFPASKNEFFYEAGGFRKFGNKFLAPVYHTSEDRNNSDPEYIDENGLPYSKGLNIKKNQALFPLKSGYSFLTNKWGKGDSILAIYNENLEQTYLFDGYCTRQKWKASRGSRVSNYVKFYDELNFFILQKYENSKPYRILIKVIDFNGNELTDWTKFPENTKDYDFETGTIIVENKNSSHLQNFKNEKLFSCDSCKICPYLKNTNGLYLIIKNGKKTIINFKGIILAESEDDKKCGYNYSKTEYIKEDLLDKTPLNFTFNFDEDDINQFVKRNQQEWLKMKNKTSP